MKNKVLQILLFLYCCTLTPSCSHLHNASSIDDKGDNYWKKNNSINFLVVGDWGRKGEYHQKDVANQMGIEAEKIHPSFILSMGDNFYPDGVISISDPQWNKSFEDIYAAYSLNIPWYTAFGNHDYRGSIQAQLDYSNVSGRWRTKERYFSFVRTLPNSSDKVIFVFIDTNPFDGTLDRMSHSDLSKQNGSLQLAWLDSTLSNTSANWKIVIGHHPLYTTGVRRDKMLDVRKSILPIFEKNKVDIYFSGHEHDLQHQKPTGFTHYFVSGAGSEIRPVTKDSSQTKFAASDHGFLSVHLKKDTFYLKVINYQGKELYRTTIIKG
jgi:hypothetical protein